MTAYAVRLTPAGAANASVAGACRRFLAATDPCAAISVFRKLKALVG